MAIKAAYSIYIDWDNDGGLFAGNFEGSFDGWSSVGTTPPQLDLVSDFAHVGAQSLRATWQEFVPGTVIDTGSEIKFGASGRGFDLGRFGGGSDADTALPLITKRFFGLAAGRRYTYSAWVRVPSSGGMQVYLDADGIAQSPMSSLADEWEQLSVDFTALDSFHQLLVYPISDPAGGEVTYIDEIMLIGPGEDVSARVLGVRTPLDITYGRDTERSLSAVSPGELAIELNNQSRDYSPNNDRSPIAGLVSAGKPIIVKSVYGGLSHMLFAGQLDDYLITPDKNTRSVQLTCLDIMAKLNATVSTQLYESLRTGDGVHRILDAIGWPTDKRDIDPGATVMQYWWAEAQAGLDALNSIISSEGPPSIAYVDGSNNFVFRDRHHRILRPKSINVQSIFVDSGAEPQFSAPMTYDIGWKDIVNTVDISIDQRQAASDYEAVFTGTDIVSLASGESTVISVQADDPFIEAIVPVQGTDYTLQYGSADLTLSRTSGQSVDITVTCINACAISGMILRAKPVTAVRTYKVFLQDSDSVARYGVVTYDDTNGSGDMPWANLNDAYAVSAVILGQRSERLPVVTFTVNNGNATRLNEILKRDISDRVHIVESETFTDHDFFIERIEHNVNDVGNNHLTTFSCEQVRTQVDPVFTFDDDSRGFDVGLFGLSGLDDPNTIFILDVSNLDEGLLGT